MNIVDELLKVALLGSAWVLYLLILLSVVSGAVLLERVWFFWRNGRRGGEHLREALMRGILRGDLDAIERELTASGTVEGGVVARSLLFREGGGRAVADALDAELGRARSDLDRGMNFLGTVGNNAPFIGLLGTVIGVILAFQNLSAAGGRADGMGDVMAGIAEALVATGVGLFVAIPAVIAFNVFSRKAGQVEQEVQTLGRLVIAFLETAERGGRVHSVSGAELPDATRESARVELAPRPVEGE